MSCLICLQYRLARSRARADSPSSLPPRVSSVDTPRREMGGAGWQHRSDVDQQRPRVATDHHQCRPVRIATRTAPLPGVENSLLDPESVHVVGAGCELEQGTLPGQHMGSVVRFARRGEREFRGLVGKGVAEAQLGLRRAVQQAVGAPVVRSGVDLPLLVLPQGVWKLAAGTVSRAARATSRSRSPAPSSVRPWASRCCLNLSGRQPGRLLPTVSRAALRMVSGSIGTRGGAFLVMLAAPRAPSDRLPLAMPDR
jgi:hypothetical protein